MLERGERVGPYIVQAHLATGGTGEVYSAFADEQPVAIKILRADKRHEPLLPWRMSNEALALSGFQHPGVVRTLGHGHHDDRPYLALEFLPTSLAQLLPVSLTRAVSLAASLAQTLAALHDVGIVHRDLKPQNVMLTSDGQTKIIDFGLAKLPVAAAPPEAPLLPLSTEPGVFFGTYEYAAPEQLVDAKRVDGRADVYSLGIMLYEMLAKRRPFLAEERGRLVSMHLNDEPPPITLYNRNLPFELVILISRMLAKEPGKRPDAKSVAKSLSQLTFNIHKPYTTWFYATPLVLLALCPAPSPTQMSLDNLLENHYSLFESALFTGTMAEATSHLEAAKADLRFHRSTKPYFNARFLYKEAALAKERGLVQEAIHLFADARAKWQTLVTAQPGQAYKAMSICADGLGEMYFHLGDAERALGLYQESGRTLPRTLATALSNRQVPSFLDYQRALVYRDRGDVTTALAALDDAEGHERTLLAQPDAGPADRWQLARVLTLQSEFLLLQGNFDRAGATAREAVAVSHEALAKEPHEKRYRLGHLLALANLREVTNAQGQPMPPNQADPLTDLRALAQGDPDNGTWSHALVEALLRRAQGSEGEQRRVLAQEALKLLEQMEKRGQWNGDIHMSRGRTLALSLTGS